MHYKFVYENNRGQRINLSEHPYYLDIEPLLDYQWSYSQKEKRRGNIIAGFAKDIQSVDLTLHIMDANAEARDEAVDYFNNVIEADIYDGIAGRLIIGDWYTWGYIIASKNTKWQYGNPVVKKVVKLVREQENWYHVVQKANYGSEQAEELYNFIEEDIKTYEGADTNSLKSLTATINPKQDLHGYDKPWSGGAGKNKLYASNIDTTVAGIHVTSDADGNIDISGTRDSSSGWKVVKNYTNIPAGTYWFSSSTPFLTLLQGYTQRPHVITIAEGDTIRLALINSMTAGQTVDVSDAHVQLELGSAETSYEPYSNICPISGWDSVNAYVTDEQKYDRSNVVIGKNWIGGTDATRATLTFDAEPSTRYRVITKGGNFSTILFIRMEDYTQITNIGINPPFDGYITTESNCNKVIVQFQKDTAITADDFSDFKCSISKECESYTTDLPETVYGGSLDVVNGVLTVDRAMVDLGTLSWAYNSNIPWFYSWTDASNRKPYAYGDVADAVSSSYAVYSRNVLISSDVVGFCIDNSGNIAVRDSRYTDATSFKTAMNGVQLVYELAEPRTIQLTPKQVTTLLGTNNVWADSGDVTVEYWDDAGRIKMASGSVVTFGKHNSMSGAGYDYPYDYMADAQSQKRIENPNSVPCDFSITIQGYADRPEVQIGDNVIAFGLEVPYGAFLTVDSSKKTAIMTLADGEQVNVFGARDPDYYLFEKIKEGKNTVTWNGSFLWEIKMLEERSEPRWLMD